MTLINEYIQHSSSSLQHTVALVYNAKGKTRRSVSKSISVVVEFPPDGTRARLAACPRKTKHKERILLQFFLNPSDVCVCVMLSRPRYKVTRTIFSPCFFFFFLLERMLRVIQLNINNATYIRANAVNVLYYKYFFLYTKLEKKKVFIYLYINCHQGIYSIEAAGCGQLRSKVAYTYIKYIANNSNKCRLSRRRALPYAELITAARSYFARCCATRRLSF